jgi:hypothetical protein
MTMNISEHQMRAAASAILRECMLSAGDDLEAGIAAAEMMAESRTEKELLAFAEEGKKDAWRESGLTALEHARDQGSQQHLLDDLDAALSHTTQSHADIKLAMDVGKLIDHCGGDVLDTPTARPLFKRWLKRTKSKEAKVKKAEPEREETYEEWKAKNDAAFQVALKKAAALRKRDGIE